MWIWKDEYVRFMDENTQLRMDNVRLNESAIGAVKIALIQMDKIESLKRRVKEQVEDVNRERRRAERAIDELLKIKTNFASYGVGPDMKEAIQSEMTDPFAEVPEIVEGYHDQMRKDIGAPLREMALGLDGQLR